MKQHADLYAHSAREHILSQVDELVAAYSLHDGIMNASIWFKALQRITWLLFYFFHTCHFQLSFWEYEWFLCNFFMLSLFYLIIEARAMLRHLVQSKLSKLVFVAMGQYIDNKVDYSEKKGLVQVNLLHVPYLTWHFHYMYSHCQNNHLLGTWWC